MYRYLIIAAMLLLTGCGHERIMLAELQESEWYKSQKTWLEETNSRRIRFGQAYIIAGTIKELRHNYKARKIESLTISPVRCLETPSLWTKWFGPNSISLTAGNNKFSAENFPVLDEYWAFGVFKGLKGRCSVNSAVRLIYDADTGTLEIIGPGAEKEFIR
ncbi:MAG: hypothetical protein PHV82_04285 [Victivallaceae bacterium]|nr:hypothetical protein [Victivallaceae bacterium]